MNMKYAMRSEDTEQINVVSWANWNVNRYPELRWLFHVPNGGSRNKQEAVKFKQMGVKAGVSDLCLPYPKGIYCGLFIEMKYGNNRQQDTQKEFLADMAAAGHFVATCYSAEEAIKVIEEYLNLAFRSWWRTRKNILFTHIRSFRPQGWMNTSRPTKYHTTYGLKKVL